MTSLFGVPVDAAYHLVSGFTRFLTPALGGLAENSAMLFSARALQGAFAAIMAPAALSLLTLASVVYVSYHH